MVLVVLCPLGKNNQTKQQQTTNHPTNRYNLPPSLSLSLSHISKPIPVNWSRSLATTRWRIEVLLSSPINWRTTPWFFVNESTCLSSLWITTGGQRQRVTAESGQVHSDKPDIPYPHTAKRQQETSDQQSNNNALQLTRRRTELSNTNSQLLALHKALQSEPQHTIKHLGSFGESERQKETRRKVACLGHCTQFAP